MVDITLEARVVNDKIYFTNQSEVEELALKILGSSKEIYFEEIPINDNIVLKFDDNLFLGWVLELLNSDCI